MGRKPKRKKVKKIICSGKQRTAVLVSPKVATVTNMLLCILYQIQMWPWKKLKSSSKIYINICFEMKCLWY